MRFRNRRFVKTHTSLMIKKKKSLVKSPSSKTDLQFPPGRIRFCVWCASSEGVRPPK